MRGYGKLLREALSAGGGRFIRHGKGDHDIWESAYGVRFPVPVAIDSRHMANAILKQAGLPKRF